MRKVADLPLWIGNAGDLQDVRAVCDTVEAVVELADSEPMASLPRSLIRCRFPLSDGGDNPAWVLVLAATTVSTFIHSGVPTLVCCSAGMSRSLCISAAGIALTRGICLQDAVSLAKGDGPADLSPALFNQVQAALIGHLGPTDRST